MFDFIIINLIGWAFRVLMLELTLYWMGLDGSCPRLSKMDHFTSTRRTAWQSKHSHLFALWEADFDPEARKQRELA